VKYQNFKATWSSRQWNSQVPFKGGQLALEKDDQDVALRVFASTLAGKVLSINLVAKSDKDAVTELIQSTGKYCSGLTLQSYNIPSGAAASAADRKQVRLYLTLGEYWSTTTHKNEAHIVRINVNAIDKASATIRNAAQLKNYSKAVMTTDPHNALARLAYVDGKLYYLLSRYNSRATISTTDVTVAIDCPAAMAMVSPLFRKWKLDKAYMGSAQEATPYLPWTELLHETSPSVAALPWEFRAYRKVLQFNSSLLIYKEVLCSQPKQPTTRPSTEICCENKRMVETSPASQSVNKAASDTGTCTMAEVMKHF